MQLIILRNTLFNQIFYTIGKELTKIQCIKITKKAL